MSDNDLRLLFPDELDPTPIEYRIPGLLTAQAKVLISAYRKTGKTSLVLNLLSALTSSEKFLGDISCSKLKGPAVYVNIELHQSMLREYLKTAGIDLKTDNLMILDFCGKISKFKILDADWREDLAYQLHQEGAKALVIDPIQPIVAVLGGDSNSNDESRYAMEMLGEIATMAELDHIIIIDHTGHADKRRARGASGKEDWADILWNIQGDGNDKRILEAVGRGIPASSADYELTNGMLHQVTVQSAPYQKVAGQATPSAKIKQALIQQDQTVKDLCVTTGLSQSTISAEIKTMEALGNIQRVGNKQPYLWRLKGF